MGAGDYMQRAHQLKMQQDLASSAADTTVSLQRTRQLMAEVLRSLTCYLCLAVPDFSPPGKACA